MKAAVVSKYGLLEVDDVARPEPAKGDILVHVHAASLNALDWYGFRGRPYFARPMMGLRRPKSGELGADFAGVVEAVGEGVDDFVAGDEVYGSASGSFAE